MTCESDSGIARRRTAQAERSVSRGAKERIEREYEAAQLACEEADRRVRQLNDELSDAASAAKSAHARLRRAERARSQS